MSGLTTDGTLIGTVARMSPEQIRGEPLEGRTDVFPLGTVLHECPTGCHPLRKDNRYETMSVILESAPHARADASRASARPSTTW